MLGFLDIKQVFLIMPIIAFLVFVVFSDAKMSADRRVGGECQYHQYEGRAKIVSITKKSEIEKSSEERYEIKFLFYPNQEIKESFAKVEGREFPLLINHNSYPGRKFLEKYDIKVGKVFDCILKVIRKGTCTPILFEFPFISPIEGENSL